MSLVRTRAIALHGLHGHLVDVEANLVNATPRLVIIGLPDTALSEARDRVRSALQHVGAPLPARHIVINLSPAGLPKHGSGFDLAIALAIAAANGVIPAEAIRDVVHLGELALDGRIRRFNGVLPAVNAAKTLGLERVVVPASNLTEAELVTGVSVHAPGSLRELLIHYGAQLDPVEAEAEASHRDLEPPAPEEAPHALEVPDLGDIRGNEQAVEALTIAAAGGHHLAMIGPPGSGKTMLARRLPGILPPLTPDQAIDVAALQSLTGRAISTPLDSSRPWQAPHHTVTAVALTGGGNLCHPGVIAQAHHGVLFLDEATEFPRTVLDVLRQPLERGEITIHRARAVVRYPAQFQLVLAANPCPCGMWGGESASCECSPLARRRYLGRLSGPLLDRIDLQVWVARNRVAMHALPAAPSTAAVQARIIEARLRAARRLSSTPWQHNAQVSARWMRTEGPALPTDATELLDCAIVRGALSLRGSERVLRVAWTMADLDQRDVPRPEDIRRALSYRTAAAL